MGGCSVAVGGGAFGPHLAQRQVTKQLQPGEEEGGCRHRADTPPDVPATLASEVREFRGPAALIDATDHDRPTDRPAQEERK